MKIFLSNPKTDQIKQSLFFSGILAIIIVVLWIGVSVYGAYSKQETDRELERLLTPINPTLDLEALREYQNSRIVPAEEFEIKVVKKEGQEISSYTFNPFTNTTNKITPPALEEAAEEIPQESTEETVEQPEISE